MTERPARTLLGAYRASQVGNGGSVFVRPDTDIPAKLERVDSVTGARTPVKELAPVDRAGLIQVQLFSYHPATGAYSYDYEKRVSTLFVVSGAK